MKPSDLLMTPLRWQAVRSPAVRLLLVKERLQSGIAVDPFSQQLRQNPYPLLRELRERDPVHWSETARGWIVTRYDDVSSLLRDPRLSSDRSVFSKSIDGVWRRNSEFQRFLESTLLGLDPPDHTRLRNLINRAFTPTVVERMRPRIEELTDELLQHASSGGVFDVMSGLAEPLPVRVIGDLLGVPNDDYSKLRIWSENLTAALDMAFSRSVLDRADQALSEMTAYFEPLVEHRRNAVQDLLGSLVQAEVQGDQLSQKELYSFCILLFVAGHQTTTHMIGNGLLALLENPEQWERLTRQSQPIQTAVEELLRYGCPVQMTSRVARESFALRGRQIRAGDFLVLSLAAANRDPEHFKEPEQLDLGRQDNRHLSFGLGAHYCVGAPLARLEGEITFQHLASRFPNMTLAAEARPQRHETVAIRGLSSLPVQLG